MPAPTHDKKCSRCKKKLTSHARCKFCNMLLHEEECCSLEGVQKKMKENCVICGQKIPYKVQWYIAHGNWCMPCSSKRALKEHSKERIEEKYHIIDNIKTLNGILKDGKSHDFGITLNFGIISRKTIQKVGQSYKVRNHADNTVQDLSAKDLEDTAKTNIGKALKKGALLKL